MAAEEVAQHPHFKGVPPDLVDTATGTNAWLLHDGGFIVDLCGHPRVDERVSAFMRGPVWTATLLQQPPSGRFTVVGNWLSMGGYDSGARQTLTSWVVTERKRIKQVIAIIPQQNAVVQMGLDVARSAIRLAGVQMDITSSVKSTIERYQLRPSTKKAP